MIRLYSDPVIATEIAYCPPTKMEAAVTFVSAEEPSQGEGKEPNKILIVFYGRMAKKAKEKIVSGTKFTFRGVVKSHIDGANAKFYQDLVAKTFAIVD